MLSLTSAFLLPVIASSYLSLSLLGQCMRLLSFVWQYLWLSAGILLAGFVLIPCCVWPAAVSSYRLTLVVTWNCLINLLVAALLVASALLLKGKVKEMPSSVTSLCSGDRGQRAGEGSSLLWCRCSRVPTGKAAIGGWLAAHQVLNKSGFVTTFCCCLKSSFLPSHTMWLKSQGRQRTLPFKAGLCLISVFSLYAVPFLDQALEGISSPFGTCSSSLPCSHSRYSFQREDDICFCVSESYWYWQFHTHSLPHHGIYALPHVDITGRS